MSHLSWQFLLISLCIFVYGVSTGSPPLVWTNNGNVLGSIDISSKGREFSSFRGIPFAQPPIGDLRFKPPVPVENWHGTLNATNFGNICAQVTTALYGIAPPGSIAGSEDCLFLNVYTPKLPSKHSKPLPVLFFVHGGVYLAFDTTQYGPQRFMDQEVVLVTTAYRLGALGFLCTGDPASPGNYGPLDQVEALKWVQKNIRYFGGDPDRVTIFGESAGGSSVSYLQLYPEAKGLFRSIIAESGSSAAVWAVQRNPLGTAKTLANYLSCPITNTDVMVDCLRTKDALDIAYASFLPRLGDLFSVPFAPCVEDPNIGLFLRGNPIELLLKGDFLNVPTIIGTNRDEGGIIVPFLPVIDSDFLQNQLPIYVYNMTLYNNIDAITDVVRNHYFKGIDLNDQPALIQAYVDVLSDSWFRSAAQLNAQLLTLHDVPTYVYSFEYEYDNSPYVIHMQELFFLFNMSGFPMLTAQDQQMSDILTGMWAKFASSLNPSEAWNPTPLARDLSYLKITNDGSSMQKGLRTADSELWEFTIPIIAGAGKTALEILRALNIF